MGEFDQFEKVTFYIFVFDNWKKKEKPENKRRKPPKRSKWY